MSLASSFRTVAVRFLQTELKTGPASIEYLRLRAWLVDLAWVDVALGSMHGGVEVWVLRDGDSEPRRLDNHHVDGVAYTDAQLEAARAAEGADLW